MRTIKEQVCSFKNLYKAMWRCSHNVKWKRSVVKYLHNGLINTYRLKKDIEDGSYKISGYTEITVHGPKERKVKAARFRDRQIQRSLCNTYVYNELTKHFIYDNHACQLYKGTDRARKRMKVHFRKAYLRYGPNAVAYVFDIHDFFGSTPHGVAKHIIDKHIRDKWARTMVEDVIDSFGPDKGIGLGSEISQLVELSMLDGLDHYIKEELHIKYYERYMDDFVIIGDDREQIKRYANLIKERLRDIGLALNTKKSRLVPLKKGFRWLGFYYRLTNTGRTLVILPNDKIKRMKRKLKKKLGLVKTGKITLESFKQGFKDWLSYANFGDNKDTIRRVGRYFNNLVREVE